jgi:hypothetical protein
MVYLNAVNKDTGKTIKVRYVRPEHLCVVITALAPKLEHRVIPYFLEPYKEEDANNKTLTNDRKKAFLFMQEEYHKYYKDDDKLGFYIEQLAIEYNLTSYRKAFDGPVIADVEMSKKEMEEYHKLQGYSS